MEKRKPITAAMKLEVLTKLGRWDCYRCWKPFWLSDMQWDHVQALVDGGEHTASNLRPVCKDCHSQKSTFEHKRNSKSKRLQKAREAHEQVLRGERTREPGRIRSRGFNSQFRRKLDGSVVRKDGIKPQPRIPSKETA